MAGEWLKFDCSLPEKPEVLAITAAMGWDDPDLTVGKLMRVFRWFDQHTVCGNAVGVTPALLNRVVGVVGLAEAMAKAGWLVVSAEGMSLANFDRHNGATAKSRALTAKRVASHRGKSDDEADGNAASVTEALAREEKRREEKVSKATPSHPPAKAGRAKVPEIPCPYESIVAAYHEALPSLPQVRLMDGKTWKARQKAMRSMWGWVLTSKRPDQSRRATNGDEALQWFRDYFAKASENDFVMGRTQRSAEHQNWRADLDYLLTERGMRQVIEKTQDAA